MADTTATRPGPDSVSSDRSFFGHPKGLAILFLTEMWERFSYYGMRGLLIIYLTQHFLFSDERSAVMYGAYTALVYVMTIVGGSLADRYLGQRKAVTFGAILLCLGHFGMAFEGSGSRQDIIFDGQAYELDAEGRGDRQQLFIDHEGERRLLRFETDPFLTIEQPGGEPRVLLGEKFNNDTKAVERAAQYALVRERKPLSENVCAMLGLGFCAGGEPAVTLEIKGEGVFPVTVGQAPPAEEGGEPEERLTIELGGRTAAIAETSNTNLQIVDFGATPKDAADDVVVATIADGAYDTSEPVREALYVNILYLSLALIIAGVGYLKANISTIVGALYDAGDIRRDSGFTIFYMGINLGAFLSSVTCGILGIVYGWKYGFGLAGIGMLAGLVVFLWGQKYLGGRADPPDEARLKKSVLGPINVEWMCYLTGLGIVAVSMALVMNAHVIREEYVGYLGVVVLVGILAYSFIKLHGAERRHMLAAMYFILAQIPFWALFEQAGSSLNLFTDRLVERTLFGWSVPAPVFQALNAGYIVIFAPIIAWLWIALGKRGWEPSTPVKFAIGVFGVGFGFLSLVWGINTESAAAMTPVLFIFLIYWVHTMAELMLSPVGLSAVTKLAPARVVGMAMGAWFLYSGLSNFLAGIIARSTGAETIGGQLTNVAAAKATYVGVYTDVAYVAMAIGVVMLLLTPVIKWLMKGADEPHQPHIPEQPVGHSQAI